MEKNCPKESEFDLKIMHTQICERFRKGQTFHFNLVFHKVNLTLTTQLLCS